jgi:hypothetical protein
MTIHAKTNQILLVTYSFWRDQRIFLDGQFGTQTDQIYSVDKNIVITLCGTELIFSFQIPFPSCEKVLGPDAHHVQPLLSLKRDPRHVTRQNVPDHAARQAWRSEL